MTTTETAGRSSSDARLARLADEVEANAYRSMFSAAPPHLRDRLGLRVETLAGATLLIAPGLPTAMFNRVIGLGWTEPARMEDVEAIRSRYRTAGVRSWWLHWNPLAAPAGFDEPLVLGGFQRAARATWAKMLCGAQPAAVATDLEVGLANARDALATAQAIVQAFEMPPFMAEWVACLREGPWRLYAVRDAGQVVGGACLHLEGACAWLGVAGVGAAHRGRGAQRALIGLRVSDALAAGASQVVTETGEATSAGEPNPSLANLQRCGFTRIASRLNLAGA